ncbi:MULTISPECIES: 2-amino-4-hydroxy-6-hydroxymethyldihydropteridine diphosphokinase [Kordiimonas]|uniref:2-amino-4-hydroxy-6- hydroxymethyldihydropteridine diphosphokinase n=1 Tax=Kordiimonas TaxID=288021 RepID=UPI00257FDEBC|nr:2-amino-4-hydroxy-6-hydroxymethyldihydropteridine diphosphokinase [Kordiimonas sp. UBA4487]
MKKQQVTLSFGANLPSRAGQPIDTIRAAIDDLASSAGEILAVSAFYRTKAVTLDGAESVPDFVNACILLETNLAPEALLGVCKAQEAAYGRVASARWSARPLDIDIIGFGDWVLPSLDVWRALAGSDDPAAFIEEPMVPHPRAHVRDFVLVPLRDVAPDWVHPVLKQSVRQLCSEIDSGARGGVIKKISAGA